MVSELPEQLIALAESLIRDPDANEASVRRAVSSAYYALFNLLIRDAIANWRQADHHAQLARAAFQNWAEVRQERWRNDICIRSCSGSDPK